MIKKTLIVASALTLSAASFAVSSAQLMSSEISNAITVTTSPLLDQPLVYDGSDLIYNYSSINHDLALLQLHQQMDQYFADNNITSNKPNVIMSGGVEAGAASSQTFHDGTENSSTLNTAEIDVAAIFSATGKSPFLYFKYFAAGCRCIGLG